MKLETDEILLKLIVIICFVLPITALINIFKSKFNGNNKLIWVMVVIWMPIIGTILYFIIGKKYKVN